jgi:hypothetical protein
VVIPGTGDDEADSTPEAEETPEDEETPEPETPEATPEGDDENDTEGSGVGLDLSSTDPGHPAVIAHGLAFLTGDQSVWQVREVEPEGADDASAETTNAAVVYQVEGTSIVRNDVTGKRALMNPGEAYFRELVPSDDVADDAFYESPLIDDYDEGVFDMVLVRYVLEPGESAELPTHTGPALVMSTNGDIDIESGGLGLLATGDGQLITEPGTVTNNSSDPAEYVLAGYGSEVADDTATTGTAADATAVPDDAATDDSTDTTDTTDTTDEGDEATEELPGDETADDGAGGEQTSINITAEAELYVVVVVDGVTAFDGPIPQGGQSGEIAGTVFEVYTSNGGATLFTNGCGEEFYMGYESGEANYYLTAEPCS